MNDKIELLPVENIEESVKSEASHIMGCNILNNSAFRDHDNLRDEGKRLKPQRVRPHEFPGLPPRVDHASKHECCGQDDDQMREFISDRIISNAVGAFESHQVDDVSRRCQEENFHAGVINRDEVQEKIEIAHRKRKKVQLLRFARQS